MKGGIGGCKILEHFTEIQTRHLFLNYLCDFLKNQIKGQMFSSFQYGCSVSDNTKKIENNNNNNFFAVGN